LGRNIVNNISSLDIYPIFYTRGSATIKYNNTIYYKYTVTNDSITYDPFVVVDSKRATVQCSGQIIELVKDSRGVPIFDGTSTINNGIISIPTGRPELIKAELTKVVENENTKVVQLTFKINNHPLYDRYKQSTVHIFNRGLIKELNSYNKSLYGGNLYTINPSNYTNITLLNSVIFYSGDKQG
jgi:hypothetical protein